MLDRIDLNADLGESYGPWRMGDDRAMLSIVTSANVACGGHAGDPETMAEVLAEAAARGVRVGAHPGYADREGFGRRVIPMGARAIARMVACQIGALLGAAALAGVRLVHVKPHGALATLAAENPAVAAAIAGAVRAVAPDLALLAISGSALEPAGKAAGLRTVPEIYADRAYLPDGRLVPRTRPDALIDDAEAAGERLLRFLDSGLMPTAGGAAIPLAAGSICVHGDSPGAVAMAARVRAILEGAGVVIAPFA